MPGRDWTREDLAAGVRDGDRRALARAISLVEDGDPLAYGVMGLSIILAGALMRPDSARWVWAAGAVCIAIAGCVGYVVAREPEPKTAPAEAAVH